MFDIHHYASFVAAIMVFQLIPGPGTIAILNATAHNGVRVGGAAVMGTVSGDFVFMLAAVAGLAAIMQANPVLFQSLQWLGAAYLALMGFQLLRTRVSGQLTAEEPKRSPIKYFRQAFAVSLTHSARSSPSLYLLVFPCLFMRQQ